MFRSVLSQDGLKKLSNHHGEIYTQNDAVKPGQDGLRQRLDNKNNNYVT